MVLCHVTMTQEAPGTLCLWAFSGLRKMPSQGCLGQTWSARRLSFLEQQSINNEQKSVEMRPCSGPLGWVSSPRAQQRDWTPVAHSGHDLPTNVSIYSFPFPTRCCTASPLPITFFSHPPNKLLALQSYPWGLLWGKPTVKWFHLTDKKTEAHKYLIWVTFPGSGQVGNEAGLCWELTTFSLLRPGRRRDVGKPDLRNISEGRYSQAWILTRLPVSAFIHHLKMSQYTSLRRAVKWHWIIEFWTSQTNANIWQIDLIAFTYNKAEL